MENSFKTLQETVDSWFWDKEWKFSREYFTRNTIPSRHECCVCFDEDEKRYFIITNYICVAYRERQEQVIMYLDVKQKHASYPQYLNAEEVYNRAIDELDLSNPEVDQEMKMGELMGLTFVEDLDMWFDEEVELNEEYQIQ